MKVTELMIGDLVRINRDGLFIKKGTIVEVRGIDGDNKFPEKDLHGVAGCRPLDESQFQGGIWCEHLDPIPLTPEVLEKNGFEKIRFETSSLAEKWGWHEKVIGRVYNRWIGITFYKEPIEGVLYLTQIETCSQKGCGINMIHSCDIEYVHQLQHAISLLGIDKKIEL